ncbi:MAG: Holliday junction resolvase-like protein [archaeon]|nr:Holliday junction resolvase-like protein [archaeon]
MVDSTTVIFLVILLVGIVVAYYIGSKAGASKKHREWEEALPGYRKEAIAKSRAVIGGQFSENLAPYLPNFPYLPTECRFLGKPTDFIVFKGMDDKKIDEVIFVEVKSGDAKLNSQEKNLKATIDKKHVRFEEYRIPKELTKGKEVEDL